LRIFLVNLYHCATAQPMSGNQDHVRRACSAGVGQPRPCASCLLSRCRATKTTCVVPAQPMSGNQDHPRADGAPTPQQQQPVPAKYLVDAKVKARNQDQGGTSAPTPVLLNGKNAHQLPDSDGKAESGDVTQAHGCWHSGASGASNEVKGVAPSRRRRREAKPDGAVLDAQACPPAAYVLQHVSVCGGGRGDSLQHVLLRLQLGKWNEDLSTGQANACMKSNDCCQVRALCYCCRRGSA